MEQNNQEQPINLINVLIRFKNALLQLWPLVLVLTLLGGIVFFARAKTTFRPRYEAQAIFTVDSGYTAEDIFSTGAYYDQYAAKQMADAFPFLLSTDMMNDLVLQQLPRGYIGGVANAEAVVDSNMLILTVQSSDPQDAYDYLCAIIECYPQVAGYMVDNPRPAYPPLQQLLRSWFHGQRYGSGATCESDYRVYLRSANQNHSDSR